MGRMARDAGGAPLDDRNRPRNGRELATSTRDRRRGGGMENGDDEEEWESVPKSPDNERRNRAGQVADSAMEWRRAGSGKQGAKVPITKEREREGGRKTSFPAWMAEESEPSWMAEGGQDDGNYQMGGGGGAGHEGDIDVDVTGMDGIQAFKAQMKERERRERERNQGSSSALAAGPPPGLERRKDADDTELKHDGMAALQSVGMTQQDRSAAALFDNFASSAKQRQQEKQQHQTHQDYAGDASEHSEMTAAEAMANRAASSANPENVVLPSRSSRFARFFDGKPQAAALAAQQKQMGGGADQSPSNTVKQESAPRDNGPNVMADLFKGLSTEKSSDVKEAAGPASPPGLHRNPSEADVQSMQKIMALLGGGGAAAHKSQDDSQATGQDAHHGRGGQQPGLPPGLPPGINIGGGGGHPEKTSPPLHQGGQHSPTSPYRNAPPPQHAQGSWANAVSNPGQPFDPRLGPFGGSPPGPGQQVPPFRPPFGMDPRLLARGGPPPQGIPPQFAGAMNGMPPMGRGMPANFGMPSFGPGVRPPPPPPLPPQLQQHLMTLPPQAQHQLLMQHFQHHAASAAPPQFGGPPPPQQQQSRHLASPGLQHSGGHSPLPPFLSPSPASSNANQSAQLMALLGQGPTNPQ
jgi:collagen type III alpha